MSMCVALALLYYCVECRVCLCAAHHPYAKLCRQPIFLRARGRRQEGREGTFMQSPPLLSLLPRSAALSIDQPSVLQDKTGHCLALPCLSSFPSPSPSPVCIVPPPSLSLLSVCLSVSLPASVSERERERDQRDCVCVCVCVCLEGSGGAVDPHRLLLITLRWLVLRVGRLAGGSLADTTPHSFIRPEGTILFTYLSKQSHPPSCVCTVHVCACPVGVRGFLSEALSCERRGPRAKNLFMDGWMDG